LHFRAFAMELPATFRGSSIWFSTYVVCFLHPVGAVAADETRPPQG
jgi:hypothetical protein